MPEKTTVKPAISCFECRGRKGSGRKVQCDAIAKAPCSNCIQAYTKCIFIRETAPSESYIKSLEKRVKATEALLKQVLADSCLDTHESKSEASQAEEDDQIHFVKPGNRRDATVPWIGFIGKSSEHFLVRAVADMKQNLTGRNIQEQYPLREEFWSPYPWETWPVEEHPIYHFPPDDLMMSLVDLYFRHINLIMPLLHRPTFDKLLARREHLDRSSKFGTVLSLVLAIGSRWSTDKRVLLDNNESLQSSGWKWYWPTRPVLFSITQCYPEATSLYELQAVCLWTIFAFGNSAPYSSWSMLGIAIRTAQAIGVHRKKPSSEEAHPVTSELLKRAWWVLVCMDTMLAAALGRGSMIRREDFDIEMPIDCDDEYWENPNLDLAFKQPPNRPSKIAFFICWIQLEDLKSCALRSLYCINERDRIDALKPQWEKNNLDLFDSAINQWVEYLPDHLRWNPDNANSEFLGQALQLHTSLYHLQILVHRPFLPRPGKEASLASLASLAICTNAARSCSHVVDIYYRRTGETMPLTVGNIFISGIILMLQLWAGRRAGVNVNLIERKADVQKCLDALSRCEARWASAGKLRHSLENLVATEPEITDVALDVNCPVSIQMDAETDELLRLLLDAGTFGIPPFAPADIYIS
ncbi:fungal-specific transcription factor domain-containing protein [Mycena floridula]|nr:fungal-specific transcription factor domain-containing protein [Mycena floridula]